MKPYFYNIDVFYHSSILCNGRKTYLYLSANKCCEIHVRLFTKTNEKYIFQTWNTVDIFFTYLSHYLRNGYTFVDQCFKQTVFLIFQVCHLFKHQKCEVGQSKIYICLRKKAQEALFLVHHIIDLYYFIFYQINGCLPHLLIDIPYLINKYERKGIF